MMLLKMIHAGQLQWPMKMLQGLKKHNNLFQAASYDKISKETKHVTK